MGEVVAADDRSCDWFFLKQSSCGEKGGQGRTALFAKRGGTESIR